MAMVPVVGSLTVNEQQILAIVNMRASNLSLVGSRFIVLCYVLFKVTPLNLFHGFKLILSLHRRAPEDGRIHEDRSNYSYVAEDDEKISHSNGKPRVRSSQEDQDYGSDFEIQDLKVCDISGDAGREYMLALCS
ncbi:hypothetical protein Dimus_001852, partial [Dionaea muscipula]